ncbi:MAG: choice-of-anchor J domain-containing protein [Lentimicrobium sp.]|nr:choice-of-anchor J domain-containing protein [Lentimicrobium sp.]
MNKNSILMRWLGAAMLGLLLLVGAGQVQAQSSLEVTPQVLDLGQRPIDAWMKPGVFTLTNTGIGAITIDASELDAPAFFGLQNPVLPITLEEGESVEVGLTTSGQATAGALSGSYVARWGSSRAVTVADIAATAFAPVQGDVWENAFVINSYPANYAAVATTNFHDVYDLPGATADGKDVVYKITTTSDKLLTVGLTATDAKMAVYAAGFNGIGGPDAGNALVSGTTAITNYQLFAGSYYLVVSTTGASYDLAVSTATMPVPVAASNPVPADGANSINNGMTLSWTFGDYTDEYQLVLGTTYPPATIVVPFTSNLASSYVLTGLQPNMQYFWQVISRNTQGTTAGTVWGFTTTIDVPTGVTASVVDLAPTTPTVAVNLSWTANTNRSFLGYNVYRDGSKQNASLLTGTTFAQSGLARNATFSYTVTAVYDEGESAPSVPAVVTTKGVGIVRGTVTESLNPTTAIAGATVVVSGPAGTYNLTTAANGFYTSQVYAGTYAIAVAAEGFIGENISGVVVAHNATVTNDFQLDEVPYPVDFVIASEMNANNVLLEWGFNDASRSLVEFQVWRQKIYQPETAVLVGNTVQNSFVDFDWGVQDWGVYQWNVVAVYSASQSPAVASNSLDKDMNTMVDVTVALNSADSPAGTYVEFTNTSEPALDLTYSTLLGATGTFSWNEFRRGTYNIEVSKRGYTGVYQTNVNIFDQTSFEWLLDEILAAPANLYVTPTGLATWEAGDAMPYDRSFLKYKVFHAGVLVAEVTDPSYQFGTNGEALVDGTEYTADVAAVYSTGQSAFASYTWTYIACDNYATPQNFAAVQVEGTTNVAVTWTMPANRDTDAVDFARITRDGEVIAEVEGTSYLDADLAFGNHTYCITFVYESGAETCPASICATVNVIGGGFVNGNVKEAAYLGGANIEGAQVTLTNTTNSAITFTFATDAAGNYTGEVLAGTYDYEVSAEGYVSASLEGISIPTTATVTENFILMEYPYSVGTVVATELSDNVAQIDWSGNGGGGTGTTEDFFEGFEAGTLPTGWVTYNVDGDMYNWENTAANYTTFDAHTGLYCMTSASYVNGVGALTPNNWLVSPALAITANSQLSFWVDGQDPAYAAEQYYVKVSTTGNAVADFTTTIHSAVSPATWGEVVVDLSAFAGQTIYIAFQHTNVTDMYFLKLDDVTVTNTVSRAAYTASVSAGVSTAMPFKTAGMTESMIQAKSAEYAQATSSRELVGYNVYRTTCATGDLQFLGFTLDQQFTDNTWGAATAGVYKWGVVAEYEQNASEIVFSNCLDKDMITNVSVAVSTTSLDSPEETEVMFTNTSEPDLALTYEVTLDATGVYAWEEFRKGTYDISVVKNGFEPIAITGYVIDGPEAFEWILEEQLLPVADLYVTPTGYATWRNGGVIPFEDFVENFDAGIPETWTIINGGTGANAAATWYMETPATNPQTAGASLDGTPFAFVDSDEAGSGTTMDEMLISPVVDASNADALFLQFDQYYNRFASNEVCTVEVFNGTEWITVLNQTADAGSWASANHQVIDVTEYMNAAFQVRFHYVSPGWNWYWAVDNVSITQATETNARSLQNYKVWIDGVFAADTEETFHQYATENLVPGQEYLSEVAAVYTTGISAKMQYTWTYLPCDSFPGPAQFNGEVIDETDVLLTWSDALPLELVQISQNPGAPANGYYQQFGYGYGVAYDMSAYPDALLNSVDFHHASWGLNGTWNYKIHVYNWDTKTLIGTFGPFQTTGNDTWEMGVELGNVSTGGANTVAILMEPLSNSSTDAYPDMSSDDASNPQGSIFGSLSDVNAIGSSTIGNFLMEAYIYTANGDVRATPVNFDVLQAPAATARIANHNASLTSAVVKQDVSRVSRVEDAFVGANIYRDGMMIAEMVADTFYVDAAVEPGTYNYCITYVYESGAESCSDANRIEVLTEDCVAPVDLTAVLAEDPATAILTWNSFAGAWLSYGDGVYADAIGLTDFSPITVAVQWNPADLAAYDGRAFDKVNIYYGTGSVGNILLQVWEGTTLIREEAVTSTIVGESWNELSFNSPVVIDATKSYRVGYTVSNYDAYPCGAQNYAGTPNSDLVFLDGVWDNLNNYIPYSWLIETHIGEATAATANVPVQSSVISKATSANLVSSPVAVNVNRSEAGRNRAFLGYNVYREGVQVNSELVLENTYQDTPGTPGNYCYTVTAVYSLCGESEHSNEACVDVLVGVENPAISNVNIYPNPSNNVVNIDLSSNISQVVVYNYVGQVVFEQNVTKAETLQLNVRNYESGAYLVKFVTRAGESFTKKVIVTK